MKKITKEIIENTPELEKDLDSLDKSVNILEKNNPKILVNKEFKKSLKSRLEGLMGIKQNKKSNFVVFAIPVFSFMFVIGGFFYYFKDIDFLDSEGNIDQTQISRFSESDIQIAEIDEIGEIFNSEINSEINNKNIEYENKLKLKNLDTRKSENINTDIDSKYNNSEEDLTPKSVMMMTKTISESIDIEKEVEKTPVSISGFSALKIEDNINKEDNQIENILDSVESEFEETFSDEVQNEPTMIMKGLGSELDSFMMDDIMEDESEEYTFQQFCEDNSGLLSGTGETLKCIKKDLECLNKDFKEEKCEFVKIKK